MPNKEAIVLVLSAPRLHINRIVHHFGKSILPAPPDDFSTLARHSSSWIFSRVRSASLSRGSWVLLGRSETSLILLSTLAWRLAAWLHWQLLYAAVPHLLISDIFLTAFVVRLVVFSGSCERDSGFIVEGGFHSIESCHWRHFVKNCRIYSCN